MISSGRLDWAASHHAAMTTLLAIYADHHSLSLQQTLFAMGEATLQQQAGIAAIRMIEDQGLLANVDRTAAIFRERLTELQSRCDAVRDVRVLGMMIGVELSIDGAAVVQACLEKRLLVNCTQGRVIRLLPAMTLSADEVHDGCDRLAEAIVEVASRS